ncbi:transposase [Crossiella equi]|uniref:Transposase n=3 Tax=Crossiella equi TaxID=130796 RepID=A0ABS5AFR4_9PSEU|nr:IS630 family transposase [Crossiella equi]MBP2475182.1 transposase [Crossiella equi]MBP2477726.1 transposase [Crossiella equi]
MAGKPQQKLVLTDGERRVLYGWAHRRKTAQGLALRARIVLLCEGGRPDGEVADVLGCCRDTVGTWRRRFIRDRLAGLADLPRPGAPRTITDAAVEEVVVTTLESAPEGATHWSRRELAKQVGMSASSVRRVWQAFGLDPHQVEYFTLSTDPHLVDKVHDVVGLYLNPPEGALVLSVDEKPGIQATERVAPVAPMTPGVPERRSFDYIRHGTIDLFAALDTATGKVISKLSPHHRAVEFRDFLDQIDRETDPALQAHLICDNLSVHKAPAIHKWLLAHPRFHLHFTPTYSSWLNEVERWFAELQRRQLDRGVFCSVDQLSEALEQWIKLWNTDPHPFRWTATADHILDKIGRHCRRISGPAH